MEDSKGTLPGGKKRSKGQRVLLYLESSLNGVILLWLADLLLKHLPKMLQYKTMLLPYPVTADLLVEALLIILLAIGITYYIRKNRSVLSAGKNSSRKMWIWLGMIMGVLLLSLIPVTNDLTAYILFTAKIHHIAGGLAAVMIMVWGMQILTHRHS